MEFPLELRIKGERKDSTSHIWAGPANNTVYDLKNKDFEKRSPCVLYNVNFLKEGTYYVWICGLGGPGDASVAIGYDDVLLKSQCVGFFGPKWGWLGCYLDGDRIAITVETSGAHKLGLWMVEDGVAIDKLIITANPKYDPKEL